MEVLLIGTKPDVAELVAQGLRRHYSHVRAQAVSRVREGVDVVKFKSPDVVTLDPNTSDVSLYQAIQHLRSSSNVPLIALGQRKHDSEAAKALDLGADDYLRSPWSSREVVARIVALLRRVQRKGADRDPVVSGPLVIKPANREVILDGRRLALTPMEYCLLYLLVQNREAAFSFGFLQQVLLGGTINGAALVLKCIKALNRKLGDDPRNSQWIASVSGSAYRFIGPPAKVGRTSQPVLQSSA